MEHLRAVVTAGGSSEPIDDVRKISNISTGRLGHALASELAATGVDTTELCPRSTVERLGNKANVSYEYFDTAENLRHLLIHRDDKPDIILHAAAVSDYKPVRTYGKIPSDQESLIIQLERTPKIISDLRERYGPEVFIAGFKLLSGASEIELIEAARAQLTRNRLNMVVANDLQNLKDGQHPVIAVTAEGGAIPFSGERTKVAKELTRFIIRRVDVQWFRSISSQEALPNEPCSAFGDMLSLIHDMHLLTDKSGNISVKTNDGIIMVSPRQVDKSSLTAQDAIPVTVDTATRTVSYSGNRKPSIDTGVSSLIYQQYPELEAIVHFHNGWGRMNTITSFPYPCGVKEEADEIIRSIQKYGNNSVAVELVHHGFLLGLKAGDRRRLEVEWSDAKLAFSEHLNRVDKKSAVDETLLQPIFDGLSIAGVVHCHPDKAVVYLPRQARGTGLGSQVIKQLIKRGYSVQTADACNVRDYYKKHGFSESFNNADKMYQLSPPAHRIYATGD